MAGFGGGGSYGFGSSSGGGGGGGGFGSPPPAPAFGNTNNGTGSTGSGPFFGSSAAAAATQPGFGSAAPPALASNSNGNGNSNSNAAWGTPVASNQTGGAGTFGSNPFGSAPTSSTGGGGFGAGPAVNTPTAASPFGGAPAAAGTGFGSVAANAGAGAGAGANAGTPPAAAGGGGFGSSNPFGSAAPASSASGPALTFGASSNVAPASSSSSNATWDTPAPSQNANNSGAFGNTNSNPFGSAPTPSSSGGGFGTSSSTTTGGGFGSSSTTMGGGFGSSSTTSAGGGGFGPSSTTAGGGFGTSTTTGGSNPFGSTPATPFGGGVNADDDGMMGDDGGNAAASTPFGTAAIPRKKRFGSESQGHDRSSAFGGGSRSPFGGDSGSGSGTFDSGSGSGTTEGGDELSRLKAKIEAKKRLAEEKKKQREAERQQQQQQQQQSEDKPSFSSFGRGNQEKKGGSSTTTDSGRLSASSSPFNPKSSRGYSTSPAPKSKSKKGGTGGQIDTAAMAAKNAERFATKMDRTTRSLLPPDLRKKAQAIDDGEDLSQPEEGEIAEDLQEEEAGGKGALSRAKSLVGKCLVMCPDEELLRREKEGDIQMLETPDPGGIHPADWTLRDTAVKRFRRSAADFKLDIPELVRPPSVLEQCCAYLEEWVMDRDRQGGDQRYSGAVPPSLDVYQFIWDRTRMIRKDFILQNYVGTSGRCSASAVRCHERIARWHAMVEHQLSHIPDYVIQQSQQNIQELGQAMKTLNNYYDDAEGRSILEEGDSHARHGCVNDIVKGGQSPTDYDGTSLQNTGDDSSAISSRIIGTANQAGHGTAEPEMRGLYILLTLNNDGGMEVLKYAASLYVNRPEVYNSRPVQLALSIFRARRDYNYARFFTILRSPDTPYLFACVMFKHVEQMRKTAIRIMCKTFGARRKDTGENMYDRYPLKELVHLLCFESDDEARQACEHYNVTVVKGGDDGDIIEWRKTDFKERRDPKKGHIVSLRPWKMCRTIESKLNGATRLAVCRGQVSGEGATLTHVRSPGGATRTSSQSFLQAQQEQQRKVAMEAETRAKEAALLQKQKEAAEKVKAEQRKKAQEEAARIAELKRRQEEKETILREAEEKERQRQLALKRAEEERQAKLQREEEEKKRREEEAGAREAERIRLEKEAAERAEAERRRAEEAARLAAIEREREAERKRAEAAERERQRQLALKRAEEERRAAEAKRRAEEEAARAAEAARLAEEARLRKIREEEERIEREWQRKEDSAMREMAFRMWHRRVDEERRNGRQTHRTLEQLDLTQTASFGRRPMSRVKHTVSQIVQPIEQPSRPVDLFYRLSNQAGRRMDLSSYLCDGLVSALVANSPGPHSISTASERCVALFKMALIVPTFANADGVCTLSMWMHSRFTLGEVVTHKRELNCEEIETRSLIVQANESKEVEGCNFAIVVIPPFDSSSRDDCLAFLLRQFSTLSESSVPSLVLNLDDNSDQSYSQSVRNIINRASQLFLGEVSPTSWTTESLEASLTSSFDAIRTVFVESQVIDGELFVIERVSLPQLCRLCLRNSLWDLENLVVEDSVDEMEYGIIGLMRNSIKCFNIELSALARELEGSLLLSWPSQEFTKTAGRLSSSVADYYSDGAALPLNWLAERSDSSSLSSSMPYLDPSRVEGILAESFGVYLVANTMTAIVENITSTAPHDIKETCKELLWDTQYRHALDTALVFQDSTCKTPPEDIVYLPKCEIAGIVDRVLARVSELYLPKDEVPALTADTAPMTRGPSAHKVADASWKSAAWTPDSTMRAKRRSPKGGKSNSDTLQQNKRQRVSSQNTPVGRSRSGVNSTRRSSAGKPGRKKKLTDDQKQSMAFTAELERMLQGETTFDLEIGDKNGMLSDILSNSGSIELPKNVRL